MRTHQQLNAQIAAFGLRAQAAELHRSLDAQTRLSAERRAAIQNESEKALARVRQILCGTLLATVLLLAITVHAQQSEPVPLPPEYQAQATELMQKLFKLRGNYAEAISLFQEYQQRRDALMAQFRKVAIDGGIAAKLTQEQIDNASFVVDGKGIGRWVPRRSTGTEPLPYFAVNEEPELKEQNGATYTVQESDGYKNIVHKSVSAVKDVLPQFAKDWYFDLTNKGTGPVTINPSVPINGTESFTLMPGKSIRIVSTGEGYRTVDFNGRN